MKILATLGLVSFAALVALTHRAETALYGHPLSRTQAEDGAEPLPAGASFNRNKIADGAYEVSYGFRNFNQDDLRLSFVVVQAELEASLKEFGWRKTDVDQIRDKKKVLEYFHSRGFRVLPGDVVSADVPLMVRRNTKRLNAMALALSHESEARHYGSDDVIGAAAALIQTAVQYRIPPDIDHGYHIGGIYPPPRTLVYGWGDCDTKTALLGSILANWDGTHAVGIALPEHYLMGIERVPRQGDAFVEYKGTQYVLVEPAGPAWLPPGTVGEHTQAMLDQISGVPIEPF